MGIAGFQLLGAQVAIFDNANYVDTAGGAFDKSDTLQASLADSFNEATPFTGKGATALKAALAHAQVLVIPDLENGNLGADLSAEAIDVLRKFVEDGGSLVICGTNGGRAAKFLNKVFDTSLDYADTYGEGQNIDQAIGVAGTAFEGDPATVPANNEVNTIESASLPGNALNLYGINGESAAFAMPVGLGQVTYLGWDWFNAEPLGDQDGGWLEVLSSAVSLRTGKLLMAGGGDNLITNGNGKTTTKADVVFASAGDDTIEGGNGFDILIGAGDDDEIDGGKGNDRISGGDGKDRLTGGKGGDTFAFDDGIAQVDRILDFKPGKDVIFLFEHIFTELDLGALPAGAFHIGATATDGDHRILYDDETGRLRYDADGDLGGAAVVFAKLDPGLNLTAADFFVEQLVL